MPQPRKPGERPDRSSWGALAPRPKVAASGAAGALTVVLVFVAEQFGLSIPPEVASAVTALLGFAAGYLKKESNDG